MGSWGSSNKHGQGIDSKRTVLNPPFNFYCFTCHFWKMSQEPLWVWAWRCLSSANVFSAITTLYSCTCCSVHTVFSDLISSYLRSSSPPLIPLYLLRTINTAKHCTSLINAYLPALRPGCHLFLTPSAPICVLSLLLMQPPGGSFLFLFPFKALFPSVAFSITSWSFRSPVWSNAPRRFTWNTGQAQLIHHSPSTAATLSFIYIQGIWFIHSFFYPPFSILWLFHCSFITHLRHGHKQEHYQYF